MLVHNADSLEKPFKCSVCDKAFSFKEYLTLHFKYVRLIKYHIKIHSIKQK